ncbi:tellurite resistance/C4-dicarboxylate transporter family protein [Alicyclobacillus mengziensis]|uniref:Tellurite resistance/C4-dicarboxylate transporter family protein n=1 Tax=Alicyclobacillus mengziensis TaxID=2931921 RepID=A0A9X7VUT9_9BACL|nr:tellurite resistance/C4-dicarboxylate transporter family protein [Alicyclobacillus mengziensis]QSO45576.1 tellurite resistance/C4-dicarboxylate transporter family protein [Alicyclobacillus mengziensis]
MRIIDGIKHSVAELYTGYFASVMATGIISIALNLTHHDLFSKTMFIIAVSLYLLLTMAYVLRAVWFPRNVWRDLTDAAKVFGYFTFVAATDVIGTCFVLNRFTKLPVWLGIVGIVSWMILTYFILMVLIFYNREPVQRVMNGGWLVTTVGVESLAALGSAMADRFPVSSGGLLLVSTAFWGLGIVIYLIFIALIMYRFFFFPVSTADLSPPYWINMGAMAITTLAGSRLALYPHKSTFLLMIKPFIEGFTFLLWAWGSWWIPLLLLIGIWKLFVLRDRLRYEPALWSIVFPLGMYTAATDTMSKVSGLQAVHRIVPYCLAVAVASWILVGIAFFVSLLRSQFLRFAWKLLRQRLMGLRW